MSYSLWNTTCLRYISVPVMHDWLEVICPHTFLFKAFPSTCVYSFKTKAWLGDLVPPQEKQASPKTLHWMAEWSPSAHSPIADIINLWRWERGGLVNARDISQMSFSPIESEIFASQKQSHLKCKDGKHNYNNCINPPFPPPKKIVKWCCRRHGGSNGGA